MVVVVGTPAGDAQSYTVILLWLTSAPLNSIAVQEPAFCSMTQDHQFLEKYLHFYLPKGFASCTSSPGSTGDVCSGYESCFWEKIRGDGMLSVNNRDLSGPYQRSIFLCSICLSPLVTAQLCNQSFLGFLCREKAHENHIVLSPSQKKHLFSNLPGPLVSLISITIK